MMRVRTLVGIAASVLLIGASPAIADTCDLTTAGTSCGGSVYSGAIFQQYTPTATSTYSIDPFLRIQAAGVEQGYNTGASSGGLNQLPGTSDLLLADVPIVVINGVEYRQFYLDINEPNAPDKRLLSLDDFRIYLSDTGGLTGYNGTTGTLAGLTAIYDLDNGLTGPDNWIKLNYSLNNGGESGDMVAYIPNSLFTGSSESYVYLYSKFGGQGGSLAADGSVDTGFEEWWIKRPPVSNSLSVPEPGVALLLLTAALVARRRSRRH